MFIIILHYFQDPTHCLTSLNTIQEKSKPFSGKKPDGLVYLRLIYIILIIWAFSLIC